MQNFVIFIEEGLLAEVLRDPMWQFIGVLVTVIVGVISIILVLRERNKKSLSYDLVSHASLVSVEKEVKDKLFIAYEGKPISQLTLNIIRLINSGNTPITAADFVSPPTILFDEKSEIISAEVSEKNPNGLEASVTYNSTQVTVNPTLLNGGDWFEIKVLSSGQGNVTSVNGRVVGVREIVKLVEHKSLYMAMAICGILLLVIGELVALRVSPLGWLLVVLGFAMYIYVYRRPRKRIRSS